jgi:K+-sensing histidine kinase KdpD
MKRFVAGLPNRRTIVAATAALIGAVIGIFLAWLLKATGHPPWSVLLIIFCAIAPSMMIASYEPRERRLTVLGWIRWRASPWLKVIMALLLVALTLFALDAFNVNPRDYAYLPLLPAVVVSALLLGFGPALVGVVAGTLISDYVYAPRPYSFAATEWKDAAGVAVFAILGAINAWMIQQIISFPE